MVATLGAAEVENGQNFEDNQSVILFDFDHLKSYFKAALIISCNSFVGPQVEMSILQ